ncbi:MAG: hypothetical protein OEY23_12760 [Acidimicrobiia bacterium]|nr:hypothetical protein [Acidimicrobiia bacterium]
MRIAAVARSAWCLVVAALLASLLACSSGRPGSDDAMSGDGSAQADRSERADQGSDDGDRENGGDRDGNDDGEGSDDEAPAPDPRPLIEGEAALSPPPFWDVAGRRQPASLPTEQGCDRIVGEGESIQDAIDAVTDPVAPYVLCVAGIHTGGGAPPSLDRPGIGAYYGGILLRDRAHFTLRGLPGSVIYGVHNDDITPPESAPADAQYPNDKAILLKVENGVDITLEGLTIDGKARGEPQLNRLIWLQATVDSTVRFNRVRNGGGECIRLKANSQRNELHHNEVLGCGVWQMTERNPVERLRKNGEAIYIGTDPAQIATTQVTKQAYFGLDETLVTDRSSFNWVHHNHLAPGPPGGGYGNECVDIKEDWPEPRADLAGDVARGEPGHNWVTDNDCSGQFDPESGGFDSRGPNNVFAHNIVRGDISGAAIRIGAKEKDIGDDSVDWKATDNEVRLNVLASYDTRAAVKAWDDQPLAGGLATCGNVDGDGELLGRKDFATDHDAGDNRARCERHWAPGPRGPVGVPLR